MIVQDDAVVCRNFAQAVEQVALAKPDDPVCLYLTGKGMKTLRQAARERGRYVLLHSQDFLPVVCVLWPRAKAEHFLHWSEKIKLPGHPNPRSDDAVAGYWMSKTRQQVYATLPSLVDHPDDVPSVKGLRYQPRAQRARPRPPFRWIGGADPLELDWSP